MSHAQYTTQLSETLQRWLRRQSRHLPQTWRDATLVLLRLNLDPARPLLAPLYAPGPRGRPPYDPLCILRALLLMLLLHYKSLPTWAHDLKRHPRLAQIAGFARFHTPASAEQPRPHDLLRRLEDLLFACAVLPSAQRGLLGNLQKLVLCGGSAALPTGASPHGRPTCDCRTHGIWRCDHERFYRDPTATWGYDSYRATFSATATSSTVS